MSTPSNVHRHLRANIVGYVALFCFATSGVASALPGRNTVDSGDIVNKQVKAGDLANGAVKPGKVADYAIGTEKLANGAVTAEKLDPAAIPDATIEDDSVTTAKLAAGAVTLPKLAAGSVGSSQVVDNDLTGADVLESSLAKVPDADQLDGFNSTAFLQASTTAGGDLNGLFSNLQLKPGVVGTEEIASFGVTGSKLASNSVTSAKIVDGTIRSEDILGSAVTEAKIASNAVTGSKVANNAVTSSKIAMEQVRANDLGPISTSDGTASVAAGGIGTATATCPAGAQLVSGGSHIGDELKLIYSRRSPSNSNSWLVRAKNESFSLRIVTAEAYCLEA